MDMEYQTHKKFWDHIWKVTPKWKGRKDEEKWKGKSEEKPNGEESNEEGKEGEQK